MQLLYKMLLQQVNVIYNVLLAVQYLSRNF